MVWFSFLHCTNLCISCDKNLEEFLMLCFMLWASCCSFLSIKIYVYSWVDLLFVKILYFIVFIFLLCIRILHLNFTCTLFPIYWHLLFLFLNFTFDVLVRFELIHIDQHRVSFKVLNGHNNTMLFGNTYYTLYGPSHFLVNFPRCDLLPFGNHKT
jgi:hypothetical protein